MIPYFSFFKTGAQHVTDRSLETICQALAKHVETDLQRIAKYDNGTKAVTVGPDTPLPPDKSTCYELFNEHLRVQIKDSAGRINIAVWCGDYEAAKAISKTVKGVYKE
jgi:hypothetical protein